MNMKRILILLLGLFSVAYGQFSPTSAKTAFKNGISIGTKDSTAYAANDSLVVVINRQGRLMYRSTDGYWKLLANAASSDYVPYTGAVDNVALGNFRLTARSLRTDSIYANGSGGMYLLTNSGNPVAHWGSGGSVEVDFKGFAGYDANRASSYTARSFTDKNYVDSADALRVRYTDTAAMLAPFVQYSDTTGLYSQVVRTFGTQTVWGNKTFSNTINASGDLIFQGANNNKIEWNGEDGIIYTNGGSYLTFGASGNASNLTFDRSAARWGLGTAAPTATFDVNGTVKATTIVKSGGTSSQFLKADGSVDGTSYATAASLSGYLPLSGGTMIQGADIQMVGNDPGNGFISFRNVNNGSRIFRLTAGKPNVNQTGFSIFDQTSNAIRFHIKDNGDFELNGAAAFTGALNGTSLSMSGGAVITSASSSTSISDSYTNAVIRSAGGGGSLSLSIGHDGAANRPFIQSNTNGTAFSLLIQPYGGATLLAGATDDGTNKLIVNGGVKGNSNIYTETTNAQLYALDGAIKTKVQSQTAGATQGVLGTESNHDLAIVTNNVTRLGISSTGAATFSSSVTASSLVSNASISAASSITAGTGITVSGNTVPKFVINRGTYTTSGLIEYLNNSSLRWATGLNGNQGGYFIYNGSAGANAFNIDTLSNATFASTVYAQGYRFAYAAKSSNYTLTDNDDYINVTSSCTITLPTAVGRSGKRYVIKCTGSAVATIASTSSQTIDGNTASTYTFGGPNFNIMIVYSDGSNWFLEAWQTGI